MSDGRGHPDLNYHDDDTRLSVWRTDTQGNQTLLYSGWPEGDGAYRLRDGTVIGHTVGSTSAVLDGDALRNARPYDRDFPLVVAATTANQPCPPPLPDYHSGMSKEAADYQHQVSGLPPGLAIYQIDHNPRPGDKSFVSYSTDATDSLRPRRKSGNSSVPRPATRGFPIGMAPAPDSAEAVSLAALFAEALACYQGGQAEPALALCRRLLAVDTAHRGALFITSVIGADRAAQAGELEDASERYRLAVEQMPNQPDLLNNFGVILHRQGRLTEAVKRYREALFYQPENAGARANLEVAHAELRSLSGNATAGGVIDLFDAALRHHQAGRITEAKRLYRLLLELAPDNPVILSHLALASPPQEAIALLRHGVAVRPDAADLRLALAGRLRDDGQVDEALDHYRALLAPGSDQPDLHLALASILLAKGRLDEAKAHLEQHLASRPNNAEAHNDLGGIHKAQGNLRAAAECYSRAAALKPDYYAPYFNLGVVFAAAEQYGLAADWFKRAAAINTADPTATWNLISVLESASRLAEADHYRTLAIRPAPLAIDTAPDPRLTLLVLWNHGAGNIPYGTLIDPAHTTCVKWYADLATDQQEAALPPFDVAFNIIGNAEHVEPSRARIDGFRRRCPRPLLNPPERVAPTRRDRMPALLAGIPDLVIPPVVRIERSGLGPGLAEALVASGLTWPVLSRPVSGQGGKGVELLDGPDALATAVFPDADAFYFISYHDYRSPDGFWRKYRTIFVDRRPHPYHLAISPRWLVHYDSAEMLSEPWKREEERRFLEDHAAVLGPTAFAALTAIGKRMDLDYAGIDYSVLADGRVLVFEANATMSVVLPDAELYPYKQAPVKAIYGAFQAMLERRRAA